MSTSTAPPPAVHHYEEDTSRGGQFIGWLKQQYALYILVALLVVATITKGAVFWGGTKTYTSTLSGGNQQKVVVAKWMETDPDFVVLDEPTKGIDVGARANIYEIIHSVAARGKGVLVVSSEAEELLSLCHRILVMRNGQIVAEFDPDHADTDDLIRTALTHQD